MHPSHHHRTAISSAINPLNLNNKNLIKHSCTVLGASKKDSINQIKDSIRELIYFHKDSKVSKGTIA
jgi:hypothetical protein